MNYASSLSPALWDLLVHARLQPGPALELFDRELHAVFEASEDPRVIAARNAATVEFYGGKEMSFAHVLASRVDTQVRMGEWRIAVLPIRIDGSAVGLLVATAPSEHGDAPATLAHGRVWRTAIEEDLQKSERLHAMERRLQRASAVARFSVDIQDSDSEDQLIAAVLQALSVWHDVEARAYRKDLSGAFVLRSTLPGVDVTAAPRVLTSLPQSRQSMGPSARVERVGPDDHAHEWGFLIRAATSEEWLLAAAGASAPPAGDGLEALLDAFSAALVRVREAEMRAFQRELDYLLSGGPQGEPPQMAMELLTKICGHVGATEGRWTTGDSGAAASPRADRAATTMCIPLAAGRNRFSEVFLRRDDDDPFFPSDTQALSAIAPLLSAWLCGGAGLSDWMISLGVPAPIDAESASQYSAPGQS